MTELRELAAEIERLREKLKQLQSGQSDYAPQYYVYVDRKRGIVSGEVIED